MTSRNDFSSARMLFKVVVAAAAVLLSAYLLWKLRRLIVPVTVGGLMAYICRPLIAHLERCRMPRSLAIGVLLVVFVLAGFFIGDCLQAAERDRPRLRRLIISIGAALVGTLPKPFVIKHPMKTSWPGS